MKKFINSALLLVVVVFYGCQSSELGVVKGSKEQWLTDRIQNPLTGKGVSYKVRNYLTEEALEEEYTTNPERVLKQLNKRFNETKDKNVLLALIELTYAQGREKTGLEALSYFLSSAAYSSTFFDTAKIPDPSPFSPHFLYVCRCYNYAIAEIITLMQSQEMSLQAKHEIPLLQGMMTIEPSKSSLPYPFANYEKFLICSNYVSYGFLTSSRSFGLGVPLIAIQGDTGKVISKKIKGDIYNLSSSPAPATAFFRIKHSKSGNLKGNNKSLKDLQGVDGLDPQNIVMRFMAEQPLNAKYHSIIGNAKEAGVIGGTDGIVSYSSAHLDGSESEIVIKSTHNTQKMPAGIKEVHRILLKHLKESKVE